MKSTSVVLIFAMLTVLAIAFSCKNTHDTESGQMNEWQSLFNGTDLSGWYTWQRQPEPTSDVPGMDRDAEGNYLEPLGLSNDPLDVFTIVTEDSEAAIRISGEVFGILVTEKEFENYHLKLQFKWGVKKYPPREELKRDSGLLYHSIGPEGAWGGVWMKSLECQIQEGDCGDYISVDTVMVDIPAVFNEEDNLYYYQEGEDVETIKFSPERSYCHHLQEDYENPTGEWNTIEVYTVNGNSIHLVNGKVNMRVYNARHLDKGEEVPLSRGKIQLQSEGAEIFYRNIQIRNLNEIPADLTSRVP